MDSPTDAPAGVSPGRPLFLIANDLEIDFPLLNAIELGRGEEAQLSNCYVQVWHSQAYIRCFSKLGRNLGKHKLVASEMR